MKLKNIVQISIISFGLVCLMGNASAVKSPCDKIKNPKHRLACELKTKPTTESLKKALEGPANKVVGSEVSTVGDTAMYQFNRTGAVAVGSLSASGRESGPASTPVTAR